MSSVLCQGGLLSSRIRPANTPDPAAARRQPGRDCPSRWYPCDLSVRRRAGCPKSFLEEHPRHRSGSGCGSCRFVRFRERGRVHPAATRIRRMSRASEGIRIGLIVVGGTHATGTSLGSRVLMGRLPHRADARKPKKSQTKGGRISLPFLHFQQNRHATERSWS